MNPYSGRPEYSYWRQGVAAPSWQDVDPIVDVPFTIARGDRVATAGSCFAQHLSRTLQQDGFSYLVTETFADHPGTRNEGYGVFSARFGNVYTTRQLLQLFDRAYGLYRPRDRWFVTRSGVVDPFRPRIQKGGFTTPEFLETDRIRHLAAVRRMFERCDVFIFTLGLTEYWASAFDDAVFPLAPGAVSDDLDPADYRFGNFTVGEMLDDLREFVAKLRRVNSNVRILLTVSPVALIATYEDRHVLVSTVASKAALRATADEICRGDPAIGYFPSYEIITGPHTAGRFFTDDLRDVRPEGVAHVMAIFRRHFLKQDGVSGAAAVPSPVKAAGPSCAEVLPAAPKATVTAEQEQRYRELVGIVCDEEALVRADVAGS